MASDRSVILGELSRDTAVYVAGQVYDTEDGYPWHVVSYQGKVGYIRSDLLRMMTDEELAAYLERGSAETAVPEVTAAPYDSSALSSYGYVYSANSGVINLRRNPSTG